ncbi:hypothetical protein T09_1017 [Trichinella sp. T9]|nr:hypothetical protein T09_1017 [Trichinella sp. T9]
MATVHFSLLGKKKCRVWTKFVQLLWNNLLLNFALFLSQYIEFGRNLCIYSAVIDFVPALDHSEEKRYEEEFDVYDNEDPKREERIIDYYYETAEYIEKSNEVYSYFMRTATVKIGTYEYKFDGV